MPLKLEDDHMCYVCGQKNPHGLRLKFDRPKKGHLTAEVVFAKHHQGFKDIVHGGMIAMVLDEMIVNLAWKEGIPAVTGELSVRLKKPSKIGEKLYLEGHIEKDEGRVLYARSEAKNESGETLATATAKCVRIRTPHKVAHV